MQSHSSYMQSYCCCSDYRVYFMQTPANTYTNCYHQMQPKTYIHTYRNKERNEEQ